MHYAFGGVWKKHRHDNVAIAAYTGGEL